MPAPSRRDRLLDDLVDYWFELTLLGMLLLTGVAVVVIPVLIVVVLGRHC